MSVQKGPRERAMRGSGTDVRRYWVSSSSNHLRPHECWTWLGLCLVTFLLHSTSFAQSANSDIRAYNHQGIQKLIALDVLRASRVANGQAQLVVGSRFFTANTKSQTRLAVLTDNYLRGRNLQFSSLVLIDGRTGRAIASYDPAQGLRPR